MEYRAYFIDGEQHVSDAADINAATVAEAIQDARRLGGDRSFELWRIDQFLCRFERIEAPARQRPA